MPDLTPEITVSIPTPVAADLALSVGAILHRAEHDRTAAIIGKAPAWTDAQVRSYEAFRQFGDLLSRAIAGAMLAAGLPAELISQQTGMSVDQVNECRT